MRRRSVLPWLLFLSVIGLPISGLTQNFNASVSGMVTDPTGAAIPNADVTLRSVAREAIAHTKTGPDGLYAFPNLTTGIYELKVSATGFRDYDQTGIELAINAHMRQDVKMELGTAVQTVEVAANASPLNYETPAQGGGITPETLKELPLLVSGNPRSAIAFAILEPGITTGGTANPFDARINGGQQSGDEAMVDGVSMQEGFMNQNGMVSLYQDWPMTPDMVSEVKVLTSNYDPQFGSTNSGVLIAVTKSGTDTYHGGVYEYHRNTWLNARPFDSFNRVDNGTEVPETARPKDLENDVGGFIGGKAKVPGLWSGHKRTYFYVNFEAFRIVGGVNRPTLNLPTMQERQGDFSDWKDSNGNLIPIYDPATTAANPAFDSSKPVDASNQPYTRQQFMGCDGAHPNVICSTDPRLQNSLAPKWLQYLPQPNLPGTLNNYRVPTPVPDTILAQTNYWLFTMDHYYGEKQHIKGMVWYQGAPPKFVSTMPLQLATETFSAPQYTFVDRLNWDYSISSTVLNHAAFGYLDRNEGYGCVDEKYANVIPQIPGVPLANIPPAIGLGEFQGFGCTAGLSHGNVTRRPTAITNDMLTWIRGRHELKFGGEFRWIAGYVHSNGGQSGYFNFSDAETGLAAPPAGATATGNSLASFLLEQVDNAGATFYAIQSNYPRQHAWSWFVGDTWKITPKLTVDYGVRWDTFSPSTEKWNRMSFFDPSSPNAGAGGRPGRLAFAGTQWGPASFGRNEPENIWHKGFAPRLGIAYSLNPKNVIRAGYGIFYQQAFYPGWGGGISQDGFVANPYFHATPYGQQAALKLSDGIPAPGPNSFQLPPFIDSTFLNGQGAPNYRPFDANRLSYAQQWNLSVEHQFTNNFYVDVAYVANKGTRLPSRTAPINVLDPALLAQYGPQLSDAFGSTDTVVDGVAAPYAGWASQMAGCTATVAQALLPYPQYCGNIQGLNENAGSSTYHSLQIKAEKRMSHGMSLLGSYTWSKLLTTATENTQADANTWSGAQGVISPFERHRNKALASDDVPQVLSLTYVYELPFGNGKRFLSRGGLLNKAVGGWQMSTIFRVSSGIPFFFRSGYCNVPYEFRQGCIPGMLPGANPFVQSKSGYDPGRGLDPSTGLSTPLLNVNAFESKDLFSGFYSGSGSRITTLRGFSYHSQNLALIKNTQLTERLNFQIRGEFFNLWNWHIFNSSGEWGGLAFNNDVGDPTHFGQWNGSVTDPRNIQIGVRLEF